IQEEMTQFSEDYNDWRQNISDMHAFAQNRAALFVDHIQRSNRYDFPTLESPVVSSAVPGSVLLVPGTSISLRGRRFESTTRIFFNGVESPRVLRISSGRLTVDLPFDTKVIGADVTIRALNPTSGNEGEYSGLLAIEAPVPELLSLSLTKGQSTGNELVLIEGDNFLAGAEVFFGDTRARVLQIDDRSRRTITVLTPPGEGTVDVRVVNTQPDRLESSNTLSFEYEGVALPRFIRADVNTDGSLNISDPVRILSALFLGNNELRCRAAADVDRSGTINLSDAVYALSYLFIQGPSIPAPHPECGEDEINELPCSSSC
ncbi:MAG: IPT/TIG domain-containing protein, partial [Planctomycetota bacterium]